MNTLLAWDRNGGRLTKDAPRLTSDSSPSPSLAATSSSATSANRDSLDLFFNRVLRVGPRSLQSLHLSVLHPAVRSVELEEGMEVSYGSVGFVHCCNEARA